MLRQMPLAAPRIIVIMEVLLGKRQRNSVKARIMKQTLHTDKGVNTPVSLTLVCLWHISVHVLLMQHSGNWKWSVGHLQAALAWTDCPAVRLA